MVLMLVTTAQFLRYTDNEVNFLFDPHCQMQLISQDQTDP